MLKQVRFPRQEPANYGLQPVTLLSAILKKFLHFSKVTCKNTKNIFKRRQMLYGGQSHLQLGTTDYTPVKMQSWIRFLKKQDPIICHLEDRDRLKIKG